MTTSRVTGFESVRAAFLAFPREMAGKELENALAPAGGMIRDAAKAKAPVRTGKLRANILLVRDKKPRIDGMDARYVVMVRWRGKKSRADAAEFSDYWRYQEFGTAKEAAHPFMRPAFESKKTDALASIITSLAASAERIAKKLNKGHR